MAELYKVHSARLRALSLIMSVFSSTQSVLNSSDRARFNLISQQVMSPDSRVVTTVQIRSTRSNLSNSEVWCRRLELEDFLRFN